MKGTLIGCGGSTPGGSCWSRSRSSTIKALDTESATPLVPRSPSALIWPLGDALTLEFEQFQLDSAGDGGGDLVLQFEQVGQIAVASLGHDVMAGIGLDQLRRDPYPTARFAHATLDDVAHPQFLSDLPNVNGPALVGEGRGARDYREGAPACEQRDDVLGDTVGKEFLLRVAAHIGERQHRDRRLLGQSEWWFR